MKFVEWLKQYIRRYYKGNVCKRGFDSLDPLSLNRARPRLPLQTSKWR
jgi:hypothetical protein